MSVFTPLKKIKSNGDGSDSDSGEEHGTVRTHRQNSLTPRTNVYLQSPSRGTSPRVSPRGSTSSITSPLELEKLKSLEDHERKIRKAMLFRLLGVMLMVVTIFMVVVVIYLSTKHVDIQYCHFNDSDHVTPRNMKNPDVFDDLTPDEYNAVNIFMLRSTPFGITDWNSATINSSYILYIDLLLPSKTDTIQYLDNSSKKPERRAKVVVVHGNRDPPIVEEYVVSPLPKPKIVKIYKNPAHRRYPIPYTSRPVDLIDYKFLFADIINPLTERLYPLLMESYGLCYHNCTKGKNCLEIYDVAPRAIASGERKSWTWIFPAVDGYYIHPLGLEFLINHASTDVRKWYVEKIVYNGQLFENVDSLMEAYESKTLKLFYDQDYKEKPLYSSYEARGNIPKTPIQGPKLTEPEGKRFHVHGQHVTYNNWDFDFHMRPTSGLQLFNVKFHGTRIAFEISLQEVLVFYTGYGPSQTTTTYYDISWFLGASSFELARGVDCPDTAVYLDTHFWANSGKVEKYKNNICIFENNGAIPLRRHYGNDFHGGYDSYGGITDYHLVMRTVANIWNYDYVLDYIFYTNGAIEVKASATGYVQATFKLPKEDMRYGGAIHEHVMAALHQHIFNYKVDLDIAGEKNRYSTLDIGLETIESPWFKGYTKTQMKINHTLVEKESTISTVNASIPQYHIVYNEEAKNKFGAHRSYRIVNKSPIPFMMADESIAASAQFARYPIIVTQRKETELDSTTIYAQNDPWDPILDFSDFIDDESLVDEDLVAWVTTGTHHIPGTEDIPSTPTTWNQYSFFLSPHNYFSECPSAESTDNVVIRPTENGKGKTAVQTFGRSFESTCINKAVGPYGYDGIRR